MKLFIDTNVVIDVIASREPFFSASQEILSLCEEGGVEGTMSALTLCTIAYVLRKHLSPQTMRKKLGELRTVLKPVELNAAILDQAIASQIGDFEDAVQFYSAVRCEADYIITRNVKLFTKANTPVLSPIGFLALR